MRAWIEKSMFGWQPTCWKRSTYNSVLSIAGCFLYADTVAHFFGLVLIVECFLVTIEGCWREGADD